VTGVGVTTSDQDVTFLHDNCELQKLYITSSGIMSGPVFKTENDDGNTLQKFKGCSMCLKLHNLKTNNNNYIVLLE